MKFFLRQYCSRGIRFAKKGFYRHIALAIRKKGSEMETQGFVYVVEQCSQDSPFLVMCEAYDRKE